MIQNCIRLFGHDEKAEREEEECMKWVRGLHSWMVENCNIGIGYVLPDREFLKNFMKQLSIVALHLELSDMEEQITMRINSRMMIETQKMTNAIVLFGSNVL